MKYFILGAVPPPLGGVSIYCLRKFEQLRLDGSDVELFDSRSVWNLFRLVLISWKYMIFRERFDIEINVSNPFVLVLLRFTGLSKYCTFYDHNGSRRLLSSKFGQVSFKLFMTNVFRVNVVNRELVRHYKTFQVYSRSNVDVVSPFLPPTSEELALARKNFPIEYQELLTDGCRDVVLCSAWMPVSTNSEPDLYGINDFLDLYDSCGNNFSDFKFVLMVGKLGEDQFSKLLKDRIFALSERENFFFITGGYSQLPLLHRVSVLVRLTKTDGDSVSIREALLYGADVITTDVTWRPKGVITVPAGDLEAAYKKLKISLNLHREKL